MALEKEMKDLLQKGVSDAIQFAADSAAITTGSEAMNAAKSVPNRDYSQGGGFETGDVVTFADDPEEFTASVIKEGEKSYSVIGVLFRKGRTGYIRVFPSWFTNACHPCDKQGKQDESKWLMHHGEPADTLRQATGSLADVLSLLRGKTVKVTKVDKLQCRVIDREKSNVESKIWEFKAGTRKFYTMEWVDTTTTTEGE